MTKRIYQKPTLAKSKATLQSVTAISLVTGLVEVS